MQILSKKTLFRINSCKQKKKYWFEHLSYLILRVEIFKISFVELLRKFLFSSNMNKNEIFINFVRLPKRTVFTSTMILYQIDYLKQWWFMKKIDLRYKDLIKLVDLLNFKMVNFNSILSHQFLGFFEATFPTIFFIWSDCKTVRNSQFVFIIIIGGLAYILDIYFLYILPCNTRNYSKCESKIQ